MYYQNYEKLRNAKGITDYKVAKDIGLSRSVISEWKNKKITPDLMSFKKLAEYFNVTLDEMTQEER